MKKNLKKLICIGGLLIIVVGVIIGVICIRNAESESEGNGTVQEHLVNTDPKKCVVMYNLGVPELVTNAGNFSDEIITKGKKVKKPKNPKCDVAIFDGWAIYEEGVGLVDYDFKSPVNEDITLYATWKLDSDDKDNDGLNDSFETYLGMDGKNPDMDGDGVTDYAELKAGLNPNEKDSDGNGTEDGKEDSDADGLLNEEEVSLGTNVIWSDSDDDGLSDLEEKEMGSNPVIADTDQDGAPDAWEIEQGYDPTKKDDSFTFTVAQPSSDQSVIFSVEAVAPGDVAQTAQIKEVGNYTNPYFNKNVKGFINACEFSMDGNVGEVTISVEHDLNIYYNLFYLDEETGMFERVENQTNDGTVTTAKVDGTKTYALINEWAYRSSKDQMTKYFDGMDVVFMVDNSGPMWELDPNGKRQEIVQNILDSLPEGKTRVGITTYSRAADVWFTTPASELNTDFSEVEKIIAELRCLDWEDEIYMKKQTINKFPYLKEKAFHYDNHQAYHDVSFLDQLMYPGIERYIIHITDGVDDTYYSYEYENFIVPEREYWEAIYNMSESERQAYFAERGEDGDVEEELEAYTKMPKSLQEFKELSYRKIVQQFMDEGYKVITIGLGDANHDMLKMIAEQSGGAYYHVSMEATEEEQKDIAPEIDENKDSNQDGISDYYSELIRRGFLRPAGGSPEYIGMDFNANADVDGDGLLNGQEIKVIKKEPGLTDKAAGMKTVLYLEVTSNPFLADSDFDGYDDATEIATKMDPLQPSLPADLLRQLGSDSQFHSALYVNDTKNKEHYQAVMEMGALLTGNWDLTEFYRELLVDYFCDWAERNGSETEFFNSDEAFIQSSMLQLADLCNDYLERVDDWSKNEATFLLNLKDEIYEVLSESVKDKTKLNQWFFAKIGTEEIRTLKGTNQGINLYDIMEKPVYETKYRKSAFSDLFEALDHIETAQELVDSYVVLGKISANHNAFVENDRLLSAICTCSDNEYLKRAAVQVQESMRSEYNAAFEIMVTELISAGISIFVENPIADLFIGAADDVFGIEEDVKQYYEMWAYTDMAGAARYMMYQNLQGQGDYYIRAEGDYFNSYKHYLQHLLCTRILGEYKYLEWYNYDGVFQLVISENANVTGEIRSQIELLMQTGELLRIPRATYTSGKFTDIYDTLGIAY